MAQPKATTITVDPIRRKTIELAVLGTRPLILHRMSDKGLRELLFPAGRKTTADRAANLKHDPRAEFRSAAETLADGPTYLAILSTSFKAAMMTAALDLPGSTKAQIGRLVYVHDDRVAIYGHPELLMAVTRSSDKNHTPDVRTRPILSQWACRVRISYVIPLLTEQTIVNLMAAAGSVCGVGDWRQEKGKGSYGQFSLVSPDDKEWLAVMKQGRAAQLAAMEAAEPYDETSRELLAWFDHELGVRGRVEAVA